MNLEKLNQKCLLEHLKDCAFIEHISVLKAGAKMHVNSDILLSLRFNSKKSGNAKL